MRGGPARLVACVAVVAAMLIASPLPGQEPIVSACDDADAHPWVASTHRRVLAENELVSFAMSVAGAPSSCEGTVTVWAGEEYRKLNVHFEGGLVFSVETMPPGISIVELASTDGLPDAAAALGALRSLTERMGLAIDWSEAEESETDGVRVRQFWDPAAGLNASATVGRVGDAIVFLRWSIAP